MREFENLVNRVATLLSFGFTKLEIARTLNSEGIDKEMAFLAYAGAKVKLKDTCD